MSNKPLQTLSDIASEAHTLVQQADNHLNPVVAVRRGMRDAGIPADAMTIDCLQSRRRILLVLHDQQPDALLFQFTRMDDDGDPSLSGMPLNDMTSDSLVIWIQQWLAKGMTPPVS